MTGDEQDVTTRPYRPGDDRRRVHWRTTARTGELSVRRDEQPWQSRGTVLLDTRTPAHSAGARSESFEFAVAAAASIAAAMINGGYGVRLVDDLGAVLAESQSMSVEASFGVMDALANVDRRANTTLLPLATRLGGEGGEPDSVIAVLGATTPSDLTALIRAATRSTRCVCVLLDSPSWERPGGQPSAAAIAARDLLYRSGWSAVIAGPGSNLEMLWYELQGAGQTVVAAVGRMSGTGVGLLQPRSPSPRQPTSPPSGAPPPQPPAPPRDVEIPIQLLAGLATFCTALCLGNLFDGVRWWLLPVTGAIIVAGLAGELSRRVQGLAVVMPLVYLVAGWLYVIPVATHGSPYSSKISIAPWGTTWSALRSLANSGSTDIKALSVPVPERPGFLLLTVAGVYLIAAMVDAIAVALQRPAAAGLPLLALLAVPAAVVDRGVGLLAFLAACAAYLALLLASGRRRLTRWARLPAGSATGIRRATGPEARRIAAVSVVAALLLGVIIPRYSGIARQHGGVGGSGSATVIEPVVTLAQQLHSNVNEPLLTVRTNTPEYLRLTALEHFDGTTFTLGSLSANANAKVSRGLPKAAAGPSQRVEATIDVEPTLKERYLPVPYEPTKINVTGDWRLAGRNFTIFSAQTDTSNQHYTVTSQVADPTPESLRAQSAAGNLLPPDVAPSIEVPADLPVRVSKLALDLTSGYATEYDKAAAIQEYLRGPLFHYDLNGAPTGNDALSEFLFVSQTGYCEQFAGAMAVLARVAGIPARVAVGFTPGVQRTPGTWVVTNHDAHSWPELWFPQAGWVRFEPTPRDASTDPPAYTLSPAGSQVTTNPTPTPSAGQSSSAAPSAGASSSSAAEAAPVGGSNGGHGTDSAVVLGWGLGIAVLAALLLAPALLRRIRRRRRLAGSAAGPGGLWAEILDTAVDLGLPPSPNLSPRRLVQLWSRGPSGERTMPELTRSVIMEVAHAEELDRYANGASVPSRRGGPAPAGAGSVGTLARRGGPVASMARTPIGARRDFSLAIRIVAAQAAGRVAVDRLALPSARGPATRRQRTGLRAVPP